MNDHGDPVTAADPGWRDALELHRRAAERVAATAEALSDEAWNAPWAPGKWSPAIIVDHLCRTYDVLLAELAGGPGMRVRTGRLFRLVARFVIVPRLLRGASFPAGARAPRETRPSPQLRERHEALAELREKAAAVDEAMRRRRRERPDAVVTHAYFGPAPLAQSLVLCARHLEHHQRQLASIAPPPT